MIIPFDRLKTGFSVAWHDLCFFPLPVFLRGKAEDGKDDFFRLLCYPLIGALAGGVLLCAGWISRLFLSCAASSLVFALCSLLVLEGKDRVRGLSRQSRAAAAIFTGDDTANDSLRQMVSSAFFTLLLLAKVTSCAALFFHRAGGMVGAALIVNFSLRGELLCFGDANPHGVPAMKCSMQQHRILRGTALLLLFLATLSRPLLFLLLGMGGALLILVAERMAIRRGALEPELVSFCGSSAETAALLLAALLTL